MTSEEIQARLNFIQSQNTQALSRLEEISFIVGGLAHKVFQDDPEGLKKLRNAASQQAHAIVQDSLIGWNTVCRKKD